MAEFYTNLPPKDRDQLQKTMDELTTTNYQTDFEFNVGEYDSTIAFFVKRNFSRVAAESTAYADACPTEDAVLTATTDHFTATIRIPLSGEPKDHPLEVAKATTVLKRSRCCNSAAATRRPSTGV